MISHLIKKYEGALTLLFITISTLYLLFLLINSSTVLFKPYNSEVYKHKFENSQWRVPNSKTPISDEELYTYSGDLLIHGEDPILISPEVPPFGKYITGTSIVLFNNQHIASIIFAIGSLILIFFITRKITHSNLAGSIAVFLTATHSIFTDQIEHSPQMDVLQLFFLLLMIIILMNYYTKKNLVLLFFAGVVLGLFSSLKVFLLSFVLINAWLILYYLINKTHLKKWIIDFGVINTVGLISFTLTYLRFFTVGHSLWDFAGVQKWIYTFYSGSNIDMTKLIGNYLFLTLFNRWTFWSAGYPVVHFERWNITWPAIFIFGVFSIFMLFKKRMFLNKDLLLILCFFIVYNLFLLVVPIFPRYLLMLYIPLHIFLAAYIVKTTGLWKK